jgi:Domain of unknown function (DUF222)
MDSNIHSPQGPTGPADDLAALTALLGRLASCDLDWLSDTAVADQTLQLQQLADRLDGIVLRHLAATDARGAAGAEAGVQFGSTASWLRARLRMTSGAAASAVRTARALYRGPLAQSGAALCAGEISAAHANVLAAGVKDLADHVVADAEATMLDAARHLDPHWLRQTAAHLQYTVDPDRADQAARRRDERRGMWFTMTMDRMVAVWGRLTPEAAQTVMTVLDALSRPADATDTRSGGQRRADALHELARRQLQTGQLPLTGGVRPQLSVIVDLDSLTRPDRQDSPEGLVGGLGRLGGRWAGPAPWNPKRSGDWPATPPSPGSSSPASPWLAVPAAKQATPRTRAPRHPKGGWGRSWPGSPSSWAAPPPCP